MGWASGSDVAEDVWSLVKEFIPEQKKSSVALKMINLFEGMDCDTMMETSLWEIAMMRCPAIVAEGDEDIWEAAERHEVDCKICQGSFWVER